MTDNNNISLFSRYNSLEDPHLKGFFSSTRMRKHLIKSGLITRKGKIVSEKVFYLNNARLDHQKHVKEVLAQAIVNKALDDERHFRYLKKKEKEQRYKLNLVKSVKFNRSIPRDESVLPLLMPKPPSHKRPQTRARTSVGKLSASPKASLDFRSKSAGNSLKLHRQEPSMLHKTFNKSLGKITFQYLGPLI